ncbi:uncharacterized protein LOC119985699 [Tripterygium wilfordii]|nr:uncharacterized protein LOC119985699 [Tripterygium wilfordii]XP_038685956.1 uncharacterized protein LOC119985699 [Tripterygium wilfordii]
MSTISAKRRRKSSQTAITTVPPPRKRTIGASQTIHTQEDPPFVPSTSLPTAPTQVEARSAVRRHSRAPSTRVEARDDVIPDGTTRAIDGVGGIAYFVAGRNDCKKGCAACNSATVPSTVRTSRRKIRVQLDDHHGRPISDNVSSLLSHQIGVIIGTSLPMDRGYWSEVDPKEKDQAKQTLLTHFDIDIDGDSIEHFDPRVSECLDKLFAKMFREFKYELHSYFSDYAMKEEAKQNPPIEWYTREAMQGKSLYLRMLDERF